MENRTLTVVLFLFLLPLLVSAQQTKLMKKAPLKIDKPSITINKNYNIKNSILSGGYIGIDTMTNGFGFPISGITPLFFDPYSGSVALVHRGWGAHYALSSGQIWYNVSTDFGVSWKRIPGGVNTTNIQVLGRYPNMTISNPSKGDISKTTAVFTWPELLADTSDFGFLGYAADLPLGNGSPVPFLDETRNDYATQIMTWADDQSSEIFWTTPFLSSAHLKLFKTSDFATIDTLSPPQWADSVFSYNGNIGIGGTSFNGVEYVGVIAPFDATLVPNPPTGGWLVGYSKSTDKGATWNSFNIADFRNISALSNYDELFDFTKGDPFVSYQGSMGVDKNNHVHILVSVTDTTIDRDHGINSIVDIFETDSGWDGEVVFSGLDTAYFNGPGLGQIGPGAELAFDSTHTIMAVQFINSVGQGKLNDLFFTYKGITDKNWAALVNLTNSAATINNTSAHLAPFLYNVGNTFTAFSAYCYGLAPFDPAYDATTTAVIYSSPHSFSYFPTDIKDPVAVVNSFNLMQNYPNPFNPSTLIKYTLPHKNIVSLKIFDVLGREVANLVNESQEEGPHSVTFNASKLASGMYIYTLRTENQSLSKKMMLMK